MAHHDRSKDDPHAVEEVTDDECSVEIEEHRCGNDIGEPEYERNEIGRILRVVSRNRYRMKPQVQEPTAERQEYESTYLFLYFLLPEHRSDSRT